MKGTYLCLLYGWQTYHAVKGLQSQTCCLLDQVTEIQDDPH